MKLTEFIIFFILSFWISSCSSVQKEVRIESNPAGADVINKQNQVIGQTPLKLPETELSKIADGDKIFVTLVKPGFESRTLITELRGVDIHTVNLIEQSDDTFKKDVLLQHNNRSNELVREILIIQGLIASGQYQESEQLIKKYEEKFPNIAAIYVLRANLEMVKKNKSAALQYLKKAEKIDPKDPFLRSLINRYEKGQDL